MKHIVISVLSILFIGAFIGGCITPPPETKPVERAKVDPQKRPYNLALSDEELALFREAQRRQIRQGIQEEKKRLADWQKCVIVEYNHYMVERRAKQKCEPKFDLKKLTGYELGESPDSCTADNYYRFQGCGQGCFLGDRFPPFKRLHRLFGAAPGNPMYWCHMGRLADVPPDSLAIKGDYANEARLIKKRIEDACGLVMSVDPGNGYRYEDDYVVVVVGTNSPSHKPLFVDIRDKALWDGNTYIKNRLMFWKKDAWKAWDPKKIRDLVREFDSEE